MMVWLALEVEKDQADRNVIPVFAAMLSEKRKMAVGLTSFLASDWVRLIEAPFDPGMPCECNCGCRTWGGRSFLPVVMPPV